MNEKQLIRQRQKQLSKVYDPQEKFIKQQKAALPGQFEGRRQSLEQAKVNAFRDIGNQAQRQGMFFSGFKPAEQARYLGETFLPGMQDIESEQEQARLGLMEQLIGLRGDRAASMTDFREQLRQEALERKQLQEQRRWDAKQNALERQNSIATARSSGGGGDDTDYAGQLTKDMRKWFEMKDKMPSRQEQDRFVDNWMDNKGVTGAGNRQVFWDTVNSYFGRVDDPTQDWTWR